MTRYKKILDRIGPYPYSPRLLFLTIFIALISRYAPILNDYQLGLARLTLFGLVILNALWPALITGAIAWFYQKHRRWSQHSRSLYILEVASMISAVRFIGFFVEKTEIWRKYFFRFAFVQATLVSLLAGLIFGLCLNALLNFAQRATVGRLAQANDLLKVLERERTALIKAEEEGKSQLASFLHDRIQSDLMTLSLKLKKISKLSDKEDHLLLASSIERLESMRTSDLRRIIEELTPNFEVGSLQSHLVQLSKHHNYEFSTNIHMDPDNATSDLKEEKKLGIYRIFEQLLLNSHIHAECKTVDFTITKIGSTLHLDYVDDGVGVDTESLRVGSGMAVINSWISLLGAEKVIESKPGSGYRFRCEIQI